MHAKCTELLHIRKEDVVTVRSQTLVHIKVHYAKLITPYQVTVSALPTCTSHPSAVPACTPNPLHSEEESREALFIV